MQKTAEQELGRIEKRGGFDSKSRNHNLGIKAIKLLKGLLWPYPRRPIERKGNGIRDSGGVFGGTKNPEKPR